MGPVPPEFGGDATGGVHTSLLDLYTHLPPDIEASILVTNPGDDRARLASLERVFRRVIAAPGGDRARRWRAAAAGPARLGPARTLRAVAEAVRFGFSPLRFLAHAGALRAAVRETRPQVVHVHMIDHPAAYGRIAAPPVPLVVTVHSFNALKTGTASARRRTGRLVAANLSGLRHGIAVSAFVEAEARERFGCRSLRLVPNAVDTRRYAPRPAGEGGGLRVVYSGNLIPRKSVDQLVRAAALLREEDVDVTVDVAGDGPEEGALRALAADLGVAREVRFLGRLEREELRERLPGYHVLVMPSKDEGLSISLLEALASGLAVITGRPTAGTYDAVVEGVSGFYFRHGDPADLAARLGDLARDPALRERVRRGARDLMTDRFDIRHNAEQVAGLLREAAGKGTRRA